MCTYLFCFLGTFEQCLKEEKQMIEEESSQFDTDMCYTEEEEVEDPSDNEDLTDNDQTDNDDPSEPKVENLPDPPPKKKRKRVRKKVLFVV